MNASRSARTLLLVAGCGGIAGFLLRLLALKEGTDSARLLRTGSLWLLWLVLFAAAAAAVILVLLLRLPRVKKGTDASFAQRAGDPIALLLAVVLLVSGSILELLRDSSGANLYLHLGGVLAGLLMAVAALRRRLGRPVSFWLVFPVSVWAAVRLILHFKDWSFDPRVIDFCYRLFADVSALLALHFLSGFTLKVGRGRAAVLWSLLAYVFAVASVPDFLLGWGTTLGEFLICLGVGVFCLLQASQLLNKRPEAEQPPPDEMETPEDPLGITESPEIESEAPEAPQSIRADAP